jgi:putative spermidine/putrescine transport system permease protein
MGEFSEAATAETAPRVGFREAVLNFLKRPGTVTFLQLLPGTLWIAVFVGISLVSTGLFSFWKSGFSGLKEVYNTENYTSTLTDNTFWDQTGWTFQVVAILLAGVIFISYPAAYFLWRVVKSERVQTAILLLCIIPFWTSYLTRMITWIPMFGRQGLVNQALQKIGIIDQPLSFLLYTPYSMMLALWFLYVVFMIGPIFFSMTRIDESLIAAASTLGARPWKVFVRVILPLTKPGLLAGSLFVVILGFAEFFTERVIGGAQNPMMAQLIQSQVYIFNFAKASAISMLLIVITLAVVSVMLRFVDIRKI